MLAITVGVTSPNFSVAQGPTPVVASPKPCKEPALQKRMRSKTSGLVRVTAKLTPDSTAPSAKPVSTSLVGVPPAGPVLPTP